MSIGEELQAAIAGIKTRPAGMTKCGACHLTLPTADTVTKLHPQGGQTVHLCPDCAEKVDARQAVERQKRAGDEVARLVGARYKTATWKTFEAFCGRRPPPSRPPFAALQEGFVSGRSLWLWGGTGTGKTFAAAVMFRDAIENGAEIATFLPATDLVDHLRAESKQHAATSHVIEEMRKRELLVIDDLMVEKPTDFAVTEMSRVIDWRYRDDSQTIVTSNLGPPAVAKVYGARMVSRLAEMCGRSGVIHFPDGDTRLDGFKGGTN